MESASSLSAYQDSKRHCQETCRSVCDVQGLYAQVLGGAGPAIAAVPLTVVWAGTSALSLLNNIRTRQVGPLGAVQRVGFVLFTGIGQIISAFSRMGAATMTYLPPNRTGHLTDRSLLTRAVQRPPNAPDAFRSAFEEFCAGSLAGLAGTLLDPVQVCSHTVLTWPYLHLRCQLNLANWPPIDLLYVWKSLRRSSSGQIAVHIYLCALLASLQ